MFIVDSIVEYGKQTRSLLLRLQAVSLVLVGPGKTRSNLLSVLPRPQATMN